MSIPPSSPKLFAFCPPSHFNKTLLYMVWFRVILVQCRQSQMASEVPVHCGHSQWSLTFNLRSPSNIRSILTPLLSSLFIPRCYFHSSLSFLPPTLAKSWFSNMILLLIFSKCDLSTAGMFWLTVFEELMERAKTKELKCCQCPTQPRGWGGYSKKRKQHIYR